MGRKTMILGLVLVASLALPAVASASPKACRKVHRADSGWVRVTDLNGGQRGHNCRLVRRVARNIYSDGTPFRIGGTTWLESSYPDGPRARTIYENRWGHAFRMRYLG